MLLGSLVIFIDTLLFHYSFMETAMNMFYFQLTEDKLILALMGICGMIWAIVVDVRRKRKKGNPEQPHS